MAEDDDASFVRNHLTAELAEEMQLFRYGTDASGHVKVLSEDMHALHEALVGPKYNFGAPSVAAATVRVDGTLDLCHDHKTDGRGIDQERGRKVLEYVEKVWRRPVVLHSVDEKGADLELRIAAA
jgi:stage V sporulation protein R